MAVVVDMVRTQDNRGYIFGRYVKEKAENRDRPITEQFTLVADNSEVAPAVRAIAKHLSSVALVLNKISGSETMISAGSASDETAEIRIRIPIAALGNGGIPFLIKYMHETGDPTHLANWSEFHGDHAVVPAGLKDQPVAASV